MKACAYCESVIEGLQRRCVNCGAPVRFKVGLAEEREQDRAQKDIRTTLSSPTTQVLLAGLMAYMITWKR